MRLYVNHSLRSVSYGIHSRRVRNPPHGDFHSWFANLDDPKARAQIAARIDRLAAENPGAVRPVGSGVSELRIDYGPGYRVYYRRIGKIVYLLLCGGTKGTQGEDIKLAIAMAADLKR